MKVFISWSGELSRLVAELLDSWLKNTIQGIETWISTEDIDKGSLSFLAISTELAESSVGIICLTSENLDAPWVLFEAGALAKGLSKNRVCPLLINLSPKDLTPPLSQFSATRPEKTDMWKLIKAINKQRKEDGISEDILRKAFDKWWDDFDNGFREIITSYKPDKEIHGRPLEDMIEELLEISRAIQRNMPFTGTIQLAGTPWTPQQFLTVTPPVEVPENLLSGRVILQGDTGASWYIEPGVNQVYDLPSKKKPKRKKKSNKNAESTTE